MPPVRHLSTLLVLCAASALAQPSAPPAPAVVIAATAPGDAAFNDAAPGDAARRAAERFPQPVQVAALIHREVLRPVEQQPVLGRVASVARQPDGAILVVVDAAGPGWRGLLGGWLGLGARPVAVPIGALALLGEYVALMDLTPAQLLALPTFDPARTQPVPSSDTIRMGIVRPFH